MADKLAIYVHWPYCARICPYCDFNVYKGAQDDALVEAILKDLSHWRDLSGPREIISIHFGGGTPSLMRAADVAAIVKQVDELWGLPPTTEIGLEANPQDQSKANWQALKNAGVNRLSLGVQTFHDPALKLLGRDHEGAGGKSALELAVDIFDSVSLDLIFGWHRQTLELLERDLDIALTSGPNHISAYQLTIEDGTAFAKAEARGQERAVDNDQSAAFYDVVESRLKAAGFEHYEVSNYAMPGHQSRHNRAYWQGHDYVGVGPGAHGRITKHGVRSATIAHAKPAVYQAGTKKNGHGILENEILSAADWASEYLLMGLRISEGISMKRYEDLAGKSLPAGKLSDLESAGFVTRHGDQFSATPSGRLVLNTITEELLTPG